MWSGIAKEVCLGIKAMKLRMSDAEIALGRRKVMQKVAEYEVDVLSADKRKQQCFQTFLTFDIFSEK
jgi:hypothetical protein